MFIMTTKVDKRKILIAGAALVAAILLLLTLGGGEAEPTVSMAPAADSNDARVKFLTDLGWDVTAAPAEAGEIRIPRESDEVFERYNELQKSQGYDLTEFAGKKVMRYVYRINNYPDATEPVYATLLVYRDKIIGGDVTNTAPGGKLHGLSKP